MYYARAVDLTTLVALSSIASEQSAATADTETRVQQLLDYLHTHKDATLRYVASDMVLNVHSDASYLSEPKARSRLGGTFFMGMNPQDGIVWAWRTENQRFKRYFRISNSHNS